MEESKRFKEKKFFLKDYESRRDTKHEFILNFKANVINTLL